MFLNVLDVEASDVVKETLPSVTYSWDVNTTGLDPNDTNTTIPYFIFCDEDQEFENLDQEWWFWYRYTANKKILTTSKDVFAYKISVNKPTGFSKDSGALWDRYVCGTIHDLSTGDCQYGALVNSSNSPVFWYVNNNSEQSLYLGIMSYFMSLYMDESFVNTQFKSKGSATVDIVAYSKADYVSQIIAQNNTRNDLISTSNNHLSSLYTVTNNSLNELKHTNQSILNALGGLQSGAEAQNAIIQQGNSLQQAGNELQETQNELQEKENELQEESNETQEGILHKITSFFGSFFDNLIDSIVGLFVPDSEAMSSIFDRLNTFFEFHFGFLYFPFEMLALLLEALVGTGVTDIVFPEFHFMGHLIWGRMNINLADNLLLDEIFGYVRLGTGVILSMAFINYLRGFFDKRFGGGG